MLEQLSITQFRNLEQQTIQCDPKLTVICGDNGAGKTAVLEVCCYLLGGRSFRSHQVERLIHHDADSFTLVGKLVDDKQIPHTLGVMRRRDGSAQSRFDQQPLSSHVSIVKQFPVLLFAPDKASLLTEGAKPRRQLLDWGVFYHYPIFATLWQRYRRALQQRNAALKQRDHSATSWDNSLVQYAEQIDTMRREYLEILNQQLSELLASFMQQHDVQIQYYRGWGETPLQEQLQSHLQQDMKMGFTHSGPHRADIRIRVKQRPAHTVLSRGQQKLLIYGLKLAQGQLLAKQKKPVLYLLDDVSSELDEQHQQKLLELLFQHDDQVIMTAINYPSYLDAYLHCRYDIKSGKLDLSS